MAATAMVMRRALTRTFENFRRPKRSRPTTFYRGGATGRGGGVGRPLGVMPGLGVSVGLAVGVAVGVGVGVDGW